MLMSGRERRILSSQGSLSAGHNISSLNQTLRQPNLKRDVCLNAPEASEDV